MLMFCTLYMPAPAQQCVAMNSVAMCMVMAVQ